MTPILMSWSGGKDSCMALWRLQQSGRYRVSGLLTTVGQADGRVGMHGVSGEMIAMQARSLNLALFPVAIPAGATNAAYEAALSTALRPQRDQGCVTVAFGDLFLRDIRDYRDALMDRLRMTAVYPVWGEPTRALVEDFVASGFKAVVCSVDLTKLDIAFAGREVDRTLLSDLPPTVDPCGENGEFHTFVHDGPNFAFPLALSKGVSEARDGLGYRELNLI